MKMIGRIVRWAPVTVIGVVALVAQTSTPETETMAETGPSIPSTLRQELGSLIRSDAAKAKAAAPVKTVTNVDPAATPPGGAIMLDRMDVRGARSLPEFAPLRETTMETFFRTGTIAEHVGKKVTTRFWSSGNAGLVLSFRF